MAITRATATGLALLMLLLAACGASGGNPWQHQPGVTPAHVYQLTMAASSADVRLVFAITPANRGAGISSTASGDYSWASHEGAFTIQGTVPGAYKVKTQEIVIGNVTYSRLISESGLRVYQGARLYVGNTNGWTESSVVGAPRTSLLNLFSNVFFSAWLGFAPDQDVNPADLLTILRSESGSVADLGQATVDGALTTHYRTTVPLSALGASMTLQALMTTSLGVAGATVDYWIDSAGLLRQLRMAVIFPHSPPTAHSAVTPPASSPAPGGVKGHGGFNFVSAVAWKFPVTMSVVLQLSNYGTSAQVTAPPDLSISSHMSCSVTSTGFSCQGP